MSWQRHARSVGKGFMPDEVARWEAAVLDAVMRMKPGRYGITRKRIHKALHDKFIASVVDVGVVGLLDSGVLVESGADGRLELA